MRKKQIPRKQDYPRAIAVRTGTTPMNAVDDTRRREIILRIVRNQMRDDNPPETRQTYERLLAEGADEDEAMRMLGIVVMTEIYDVLKSQLPFDQARYVAALAALSAPSQEEE